MYNISTYSKSLNLLNRHPLTVLYFVLVIVLGLVTRGKFNFVENESIYIVGGLLIKNSSLFSQDLFFSLESTLLHGLPYSIIASIFWTLTDNELIVVLIMRGICWLLFFSALWYFLKVARLFSVPSLLGLIFWLISDQTLVAGEWVVNGAEQKPLAYAAVFLALACAVTRRWYLMAICIGVAFLVSRSSRRLGQYIYLCNTIA